MRSREPRGAGQGEPALDVARGCPGKHHVGGGLTVRRQARAAPGVGVAAQHDPLDQRRHCGAVDGRSRERRPDEALPPDAPGEGCSGPAHRARGAVPRAHQQEVDPPGTPGVHRLPGPDRSRAAASRTSTP